MKKHKILLIDEDPGTLDMIRQVLEGKGYEITTANNGETALDLISRKSFDLVLTDMASYLDKLRLKRKHAQSQDDLRLFKDVVASSNEAIAVSESSGRIIYVNPAHEKLFGRSLEVARSLNYRDYYPEKSVEKHNQEILPAVKRGETWEGVIATFDSKGRHFLLWQRTYATYNEEGKIHYCFTFMHDFKERKAEKNLRQAQQSQAIGTLAGGIAHEFNNILWIIMANTELAVSAIPEGNTAHKNLQRVEKACSRATDLVQQILSFSRQGEYRPRQLDIMPIVKESLKFLRSSLPTTIEIRQKISTRSATIISDPSQVHQTLINLCTNAADAMGKRPGVLEISITDVELDQEEMALHHDLAPGKYVRLSVKDTGVGIEPKVRGRIFEPFFTTKGVGEGKGMGLAVVHGIVKSCGGAIEVSSEPGKGSTFHLFFPKIEKETKPDPGVFIPSVRGKERILFVDDDQEIANMGKEILEGYGYRVESKTCSDEALEIFRDHHDKFDLIITDMIMPKMTGEELSEELLRIRPDIPIILCTGYNEEIYRERAREIGIKKVMMKPVNGYDLASAIRKALKGN